jgi:hypothetical protein
MVNLANFSTATLRKVFLDSIEAKDLGTQIKNKIVQDAIGAELIRRGVCVDDSCDLSHCSNCGKHYGGGRNSGVCNDCTDN